MGRIIGRMPNHLCAVVSAGLRDGLIERNAFIRVDLSIVGLAEEKGRT